VTVVAVSLESEILAALHTVTDPELDQPITELGFVRSVSVDDSGVAFISAADGVLLTELRLFDGLGPQDALRAVPTSARFGCCSMTITTATRSTPAWRPTPVTLAPSDRSAGESR
jgi:hypothetical protein